MAKIQMLKAVVNKRLSAAVEEVFVCFETTIREYEEELSRQRKLLDVLEPKLILHRADPLKISDREDSFPPEQLHSEQERSPSLDQEDPEPLQIKQQSQELWTNQEGEQLEGQEEGVNTKGSIFRITNVKSEFDPDQSQSSHLPLPPAPLPSILTEPDGGGCGAPEPTSDCQPPSSLNSSASHSEDSGDEWKQSDGPQSGLKRPKSNTSGKRKREACSKNRESGQLTPLDFPDSDTCKVCGKYFLKGFLSDVLKHSKVPECMWGVCGICLHSTESFKKLLETHLTCSVCNMKFSSVFQLRVHMRNHTGEKSHTCTDCGKCFAQKCKLLEHMRIHTGEKPYKCSYCGKRFRQGGTLSKHMRTHTGEKPCKCSHCGKTFAQEGALTRHIRIHTGERLYSCQYCDVKCREKSILRVHMRCHTGEKPYTCTDCGKSYVQKRSLAFHIRSHAKEKLYSCSDCGKTFTRRFSDGTCCIQRIHTGEKAYT